MGRIIFACVSTIVFLTAITGYWLIAALAVLGLAAAVIYYVYRGATLADRQARAARAGNSLVLLHSNNRWLLTMVVMCAVAIWVSSCTPSGPPVIPRGITEITKDDATAAKIAEMEQRSTNKFLYDQNKTDKELHGVPPAPTPAWAPTWRPWLVRWSATILLVLLTLLYVPFAFADEMRNAIVSAEHRLTESGSATSDTFGQRLTRRLFQVPSQVPAAAIGVAKSAIKETNWSWLKFVLLEFGGQLFGSLMRGRH